MKAISIWVTSSLVVFSSGCEDVGCKHFGGGIAGAGYDSAARRRAVDNFKGTTSRVIRERIIDNDPRVRPKQHFADVMRSFPTNVERVEDAWIHIPDTNFEARYALNTFVLRAAGRVIVNQKLPAVFNMHPVRLGVGTLGGRGIIMIRNKSRATTGRKFVGIYAHNGEVLYTRVLRGYESWDVKATDDAIEIIGSNKTRRITIKKER